MLESENTDDTKIEDGEAANPAVRRRLLNKIAAVSVVLLFGIFALQLWVHAVRTSATVDEVPHILAGHLHWQCGDFGINPEHPPLLKLLAASPLIFRDFVEPDWDCGSRLTTKLDSWLAGFSFLTKNDPDSIVIPARMAASLMSLLFALLIALAAKEMFGRVEAFVALTLLVFEPNLIAHGSLVTTDMTVSAGLFAAVFTLYRYVKQPSITGFLFVGLAVGWTLTAKHSGIIVLPILFLLLVADGLFFLAINNQTSRIRQLCRHAAAFAGFVFIGFVLLWASYGFRYHALPNATESAVSIEEHFIQIESPESVGSTLGELVKFISQTRVLPESYVLGLADVIATNSRAMFLFGEVHRTGRWFYFPFAFLIKTSIALLILLPLGIMTVKLYRERKREMLFMLLPSLLFFAVSLTSKMNIGIRHILPVYGFFIIIAAAGACEAIRKSRRHRYILAGLLILHAVTTIRLSPNYIAFANDLSGGTDNAYLMLSDSNVEWGQNLKLVNEYLAQEGITDCWFASFGGGELTRVGQPCRLLPGGFAADYTEQPIEIIPPIIEGTILISSGVFPPYSSDIYLSVVQQSTPIAQIGGSIFVYRGRFEVPLASAMSRVERGVQLVRLKRFDEAAVNAREALKLMPNDIRSHLILAMALAGTKQWDESRRELETTIQLAEANPLGFHRLGLQAQREMAKLP